MKMFKSKSGGARNSLASVLLILLSFLVLCPMAARANDLFEYTEANGNITITGLKDNDTPDVVIPSEIDGKPVVAIGESAFYESRITFIGIPASVETIGNYAFMNCHSLTSVTFDEGNKLTSIGNHAFYYCGIESISIPASVETIGYGAFYNCSSLTSVTFDEGSKLTSIEVYAFQLTKISSISIPASVVTIGYEAFYNCSSLTSVTFNRIPIAGKNINDYSPNMFEGDELLTTINVPSGCEKIYKYLLNLDEKINVTGQSIIANGLSFKVNDAQDGLVCLGFSGDEKEALVIPAKVNEVTVTSIGSDNDDATTTGTFEGKNLVSVVLPASITEIKEKTFSNNPNLKYIQVEHSVYQDLQNLTFDNNDKLVDKVVTGETDVLNLDDEKGLNNDEFYAAYVAAGKLTYQRQLPEASKYATLCLPFDFDLAQTNDVFEKIYTPKNQMIRLMANDKETFILMLREKGDNVIPANTPIFVKLAEGQDKFSITNNKDMILSTSAKPDEPTVIEVDDWDGVSGLMTENTSYEISYSSSYVPQEASSVPDLYTFASNGTFGPQKTGIYHPFRLALTVKDKNNVSALALYSISIGVNDGSTTGISEILSPKDDENAKGTPAAMRGIIFDLNGRKVGMESQLKNLPKGVYILNGKKLVVK